MTEPLQTTAPIVESLPAKAVRTLRDVYRAIYPDVPCTNEVSK